MTATSAQLLQFRNSSDPKTETPFSPAQYKIMVIDDVWMNIRGVRGQLEKVGYERFVELTDPTEALEVIDRENPDLVLLDLLMPLMSGLDVLAEIRSTKRHQHLPVLVLTASDDASLKHDALESGATDFLAKPPNIGDLSPRVRNALILKDHRDGLEQRVAERTSELEQSRKEVVCCLARAAEYRDDDTGNHVVRVGRYVGIIARAIGIEADRVESLELASTLHDVGKIGISDNILLKPGRFTEAEFATMKEHCQIGYSICQPSGHQNANQSATTALDSSIFDDVRSPLLNTAATIALTHHEKWDGSGYPNGLSMEEIPLEGRITAVADVFDALNSKRPYKAAFPFEQCFEILQTDSGTHFDPQLVDAFLSERDAVVTVANSLN